MDFNKQLKARELLIRYDQSKNEKEQKEIVAEILKMVPAYKDVEGFTKPTNLKQIKREEVKGSYEAQESEQIDPEIMKYPTKFDYDNYFGRKIIVDDMIVYGRGSAIHPVSFI